MENGARPTGRIAKLSREYDAVVLEEMPDGKFRPVGLEGFKLTPQLEDDVKKLVQQMEAKQERKTHDELSASVVALKSDRKLNRKTMDNVASEFLGYKNINLSAEQRELVRDIELTQARIWDYRQMMKVAEILVNEQHAFLKSHNDLDMLKLTYAAVARHFDNASEATIRRLIRDMRLKVGAWTVAARDLVTQSSMLEVCREIILLRQVNPNAGAPKLHALLKDMGVGVSRRTVGSALSILNRSIFLI